MKGYDLIQFLEKLAKPKKIKWKPEFKDGQLYKIKDVEIEEIDVTREYGCSQE